MLVNKKTEDIVWRICKEDNWEKFVVYNDVSSRTITSKSGANAAFVEFPSQFGATTSFSNLPINFIETGTTPTKSTFHVFLIEILTFLSCAECFLCRFFSEKELDERVIVASSTISSLGHVNLISLHNHIWRDWSVILSHPQHTPRPHTAFSLPWSVNQIKALLFTSILLGFRPTSEYFNANLLIFCLLLSDVF